jgi:hypothetical protein
VPPLCLRRVMSLRPRDLRATDAAVRAAAAATAMVLEDLEEAFRKRAWANRNEPRGSEPPGGGPPLWLTGGSTAAGGPARWTGQMWSAGA